jgi:histidinol phosphatase-like enzyme
MNARLSAAMPLAAVLVCYEDGDDCPRRKPNPGLLLEAAEAYAIDLPASYMVGDRWRDVEAGRRAGCRTVLIDNGNETEWVGGPDREPHHKAADLAEAARTIAEADRSRPEDRP